MKKKDFIKLLTLNRENVAHLDSRTFGDGWVNSKSLDIICIFNSPPDITGCGNILIFGYKNCAVSLQSFRLGGIGYADTPNVNDRIDKAESKYKKWLKEFQEAEQ